MHRATGLYWSFCAKNYATDRSKTASTAFPYVAAWEIALLLNWGWIRVFSHLLLLIRMILKHLRNQRNDSLLRVPMYSRPGVWWMHCCHNYSNHSICVCRWPIWPNTVAISAFIAGLAQLYAGRVVS